MTNAVSESPDEPPHMEYVRYIAEHHALPVQTRDEIPPDVGTNACTLSTGLYDFGSGNRLSAVDAKGQRLAEDCAILASLDVSSR